MPRFFIVLFIFMTSQSFSQEVHFSRGESPYELNWLTDGAWVGAGLSANALGLYFIQNKEPLAAEELSNLNKEDIWAFDRWAAGNYSERADDISYYPFFGSFAMPFVMMLVDKDQRSHAGQISVMLVETMATTGAFYSITAGLVDRSRPLVYNTSLPTNQRTENGAQRSFFAGHTAATAAASFFVAKVFHDFHPDSPATPYVWTAAAIVPAWVGYLRLKGGKHFLSDNLIGYGIGALSGILVPQLHKKENSRYRLYPTAGRDFQGLSLQYRF